MAGLLLGCMALPSGLGMPLPPGAGKKALLQHEQHSLGRSATALVVAAACDTMGPELGVAAAAAGAATVTAAVSNPPRTYNHTRRITVPTYCLAGTRTRPRTRRRGLAGGGDDDEFGGGDDGGSWFGGGDGGEGPWDPWGTGGDGEEGGALPARLQDLLLLWSLFCGLAFCQTLAHVTPKRQGAAPAFACLSVYSGVKARLASLAAPAC